VHYSVSWGYWLASATASQGKYHQTVHGADQAYVYAGESANAELKLSRLVYRDQRRKTALALRAQWSRSALTSQDRFSIGGRYTVRGFDGEAMQVSGYGTWSTNAGLGYRTGHCGPVVERFTPQEGHAYTVHFLWGRKPACSHVVMDATHPDAPVAVPTERFAGCAPPK
jgi:hemolysin activation/secretion protein